MNKNVVLGVDEITLMLFGKLQEVEGMSEWGVLAEDIILEFEKKSRIEQVIGEKRFSDEAKPSGYTSVYSYGHNPFYFAIGYNIAQPKMGVIVKFSAHAWNYFVSNNIKKEMNLVTFLNDVESSLYEKRLSRVDLTVDYIDWEFTVDQIYKNMIDEKILIYDTNDRVNHSKITAYEIDGVVETFYVGSKKTGTRMFMRVYDKKSEQLQSFGTRYHEAVKFSSWTRFEMVLKSTYAHQITEILSKISPDLLPALIGSKFLEKYRFYDTEQEDYTEFTKAIDGSSDEFEKFDLDSPRDNALMSSLNHIINGSGLLSAMFKCDSIWGEESSMFLLSKIYKIYKRDYRPSDDVNVWLKKHTNSNKSHRFEHDILKLMSIKKPLSRRQIQDSGTPKY